MADYNDEEYEYNLKARLEILKTKINDGKVKIAPHLIDDFRNSIANIQYSEDGGVILYTVDDRIRSMALAISHFDERDKLKKQFSLFDIQNAYFQIIENKFQPIFKKMIEENINAHQLASFYSSNDRFIKNVAPQINEFINNVYEFWRNIGDVGCWHLEDSIDNLNGIYGGDLFPSYSENIASKCGIYTDTLALPDPFVRSKYVLENSDDATRVYYFIKHGLNVLKYKDLACIDLTYPIVAILPDMQNLEEDDGRDIFRILGRNDAIIHAQNIFRTDFSSEEDLIDFMSAFKTIEDLEDQIMNKDRILFDTEWNGNFRDNFNRYKKTIPENILVGTTPGNILHSQIVSRMAISNELLLKSKQLSGVPIIEAPTSWKYFNWKLEYDSLRAENHYSVEGLHILKGLDDLSHADMPWIGDIPPESLIELRRQGALHEIRDILGDSIQNLIETNPENFNATRDQLHKNIDNSLSMHRKKLEELRQKKWKFAGRDIGSWIVMGGIEVAAALTGTESWGMGAIIAGQFLDPPQLKDIPKKYKEISAEDKAVKKSPVGLLFKSSNKNN
ncbi:hypothetical protein [Psychrobacter pocilloporae]|uniref:Uncharacterized protein n=1 Tax=Psychrobacter pocilloporae TaxID=1775882 RepID=A0ABT6ISK0_9GAMM|nr:hypothetical protein [Psychrobacter pocilloporae]MDH4904814.1 hypothetical protein [Psychrobacter pocilloporae]